MSGCGCASRDVADMQAGTCGPVTRSECGSPHSCGCGGVKTPGGLGRTPPAHFAAEDRSMSPDCLLGQTCLCGCADAPIATPKWGTLCCCGDCLRHRPAHSFFDCRVELLQGGSPVAEPVVREPPQSAEPLEPEPPVDLGDPAWWLMPQPRDLGPVAVPAHGAAACLDRSTWFPRFAVVPMCRGGVIELDAPEEQQPTIAPQQARGKGGGGGPECTCACSCEPLLVDRESLPPTPRAPPLDEVTGQRGGRPDQPELEEPELVTLPFGDAPDEGLGPLPWPPDPREVEPPQILDPGTFHFGFTHAARPSSRGVHSVSSPHFAEPNLVGRDPRPATPSPILVAPAHPSEPRPDRCVVCGVHAGAAEPAMHPMQNHARPSRADESRGARAEGRLR